MVQIWNVTYKALEYLKQCLDTRVTAFKNFHKVTPSDVRKGYQYKVFSPVNSLFQNYLSSNMDRYKSSLSLMYFENKSAMALTLLCTWYSSNAS